MRVRSGHRRIRIFLMAALPVGGLALSQLAFLTALVAAERLLLVRTSLKAADVLIVPGGDGQRRAPQAATLYRSGVAPRILVTGEGDCDESQHLLKAAGVPQSAIMIECESRNTWENAQFSAPILAEMRVRRAVLVTSWFHTRRALACFQTAAPEVQWLSAPVERAMSAWELVRHRESLQIAQEYLKIFWYGLRYQIVLP